MTAESTPQQRRNEHDRRVLLVMAVALVLLGVLGLWLGVR